jgi:hypothetical protein
MLRPSPVLRVAAALALVGWLAALIAPAPGSAAEEAAEAEEQAAPAPEAEEPTDPAPEEQAAPAPEAEPAPDAEAQPAAAPAEANWSDAALRNTNVAMDLIVIRPLAAFTLGAGAILFLPAALMTAPNGWDSVKEAYQRFVFEPAEYFYSRPLGEL